MGINKTTDRAFFAVGGSVMTSGGSLDLKKNVIGIFDVDNPTSRGAAAVADFKGKSKLTKYEFRMGTTDLPLSRTHSKRTFKSFPFTLDQVVGISYYSPSKAKDSVDKVAVGYDGVDKKTGIKFLKGDYKKAMVEFSGDFIGFMGYKSNRIEVPIFFDAKECNYLDTCETCDECLEVSCVPVVEEALESFRNYPLLAGYKVKDIADVSITKNCTTSLTPTVEQVKCYDIEVCDLGDANALGLIQAQYLKYNVERKDRKGSTSVYTVLDSKSLGKPKDYTVTAEAVLKGCADCPTGSLKVTGGHIYIVTLDPNGTPVSQTTFDSLPKFVSFEEIESYDGSISSSSVIVSEKLTPEAIATFVEKQPTSKFEYLGFIPSKCKGEAVKTYSWVESCVCEIAKQKFSIVLPDDECGNTRLEEVKQAYPMYEITEVANSQAACQRKYEMVVPTNIVCPECDDIFKDTFRAEQPAKFEGVSWVRGALVGTEGTTEKGCVCGFTITAKKLEMYPPECVIDEVGVIDTSLRIRVTGGTVSEVRFGETQMSEPFAVKYLSRWSPTSGKGYNLRQWEMESANFYSGKLNSPYAGNVEKYFKGTQSVLDPKKQYVGIAVDLHRNDYGIMRTGVTGDTVTHHTIIELGREDAFMALIKELSAASGVPIKKV